MHKISPVISKFKQPMVGYDWSANWQPFRIEGMNVLQHGTNVIDHAMSKMYEDGECEAVLLMNASNALYNRNRALLSKNMYHLSRASNAASISPRRRSTIIQPNDDSEFGRR